jgi:hypothetical protein
MTSPAQRLLPYASFGTLSKTPVMVKKLPIQDAAETCKTDDTRQSQVIDKKSSMYEITKICKTDDTRQSHVTDKKSFTQGITKARKCHDSSPRQIHENEPTSPESYAAMVAEDIKLRDPPFDRNCE